MPVCKHGLVCGGVSGWQGTGSGCGAGMLIVLRATSNGSRPVACATAEVSVYIVLAYVYPIGYIMQ